MDFNSIFNRQASGELHGYDWSGAKHSLSLWKEYIEKIAPGSPAFTAARALVLAHVQQIYRKLKATRDGDMNARGIESQLNKLEKIQRQALLGEIESFIRGRSDPEPTGADGLAALDLFLEWVGYTYPNIVFSSFMVLEMREKIYNSISVIPKNGRTDRQVDDFQESVDDIARIYAKLQADSITDREKFEALKASVKSQTPRHLHRLIDRVIQLFVYDPYELGILYIRRNLHGPIGAFHGLEEEGCE